MWNKTSTPKLDKKSNKTDTPLDMSNNETDLQIKRQTFEEDAHLDSIIMAEKECQEALTKILQDPNSQQAVVVEEQLWKYIVKCYKSHPNSSMINYLIGFYLTLCDTLFFSSSRDDNFLKFNRFSFSLDNVNQELIYHIHIRLGDLYRYVDSRNNAKFYYQQSLQIDPRRGTAYNQLALCTPLTKAYKCVYFSVRASKAIIDPVKFADSNIKLAISRLNSPIFEHFRKINNLELSGNIIDVSYPDTGSDWFYACIISIYFNSFNLTLSPLLDFIIESIDKQSDDFDYCFMALDASLDWILKDRDNIKQESLEKILKDLGSKFKDILNCDDSDKNDSKFAISQNIGLKHNFILKDFLPLKDIYERMHYYDEMQRYIPKRDRKILITRLIYKLKKF